MPPRYKPMEECRPELIDYAEELAVGTDDNDSDMRQSNSTKRYEQDLRWFDGWLDENGIESPLNLTPPKASRVGRSLSQQFNGTTPRYRWDRVFALYEYFVAMGMIGTNPLEKWDSRKTEKWGMTKTSEQSKRLNDGERYALSQEEVRSIEDNVGRNRLRNQLLIRCLWHTAMRRGEASLVTVDMLDRSAREILLPGSVTKSGKPRVVVWQPSLDGMLTKWLDNGLRETYLGGETHDHLFVGERGAPLSAGAINDVVVESACRAGINRKLYRDANAAAPDNEDEEPLANRWKITAHSVRHGAASTLVHDTDMGLYEVSKYLDHSSVDITEQTYVEYDPRAGTDDAHRFGVK